MNALEAIDKTIEKWKESTEIGVSSKSCGLCELAEGGCSQCIWYKRYGFCTKDKDFEEIFAGSMHF